MKGPKHSRCTRMRGSTIRDTGDKHGCVCDQVAGVLVAPLS